MQNVLIDLIKDLHGMWDMPINALYYLLQIALTVVAWLVIIYFINLGLKQVDDAKKLEMKKIHSKTKTEAD